MSESLPSPTTRLTPAEMWKAFLRRDARYDGRFVTGVRTTGVFCRPTCTCRKPRRDRVVYFPTPDEAARAGYRPCKRCRPELAGGRAEVDRRLVERALALLRGRLTEPWTLAAIARELAMSASNFSRRFRTADGRPPMRALADLRAEQAEGLLADPRTGVLEVALEAGFGSPSALTRAFRRRTGLPPAAWRTRRRAG